MDGAARDRDPARDLLVADIDHARPALLIQVTQLCHKQPAFGCATDIQIELVLKQLSLSL